MYHSITIDGINTWDDLHLIPTSRPLVNPPSVSMNQVAIPGMDGFIDLTEVLSGRVNYGARQGSWEFIAHPDWTDAEPWHYKYSRIMQLFHGKAVSQVILEDDPFFYYTGRVSVNQWRSGESWSTVTLDYVLQPYKYERICSDEPWMWDPFSFVNGIIRNYNDDNGLIIVTSSGSESATFTIKNGDEPVVPTFIVSGIPESTGGAYYTLYVENSANENACLLSNGTNEKSTFMLAPGVNELTFTGDGTINAIRFRAGWL